MLAPRGNSETLMFKETMANTSIDQHPVAKGSKLQLDALIIGAGFSGLYQLHLLRDKLHLKAAIVEAGAGVGGTWYWNRYPGARCDSESHTYCYYFSDEILNEWRWSERYPGQAEILSYLNFCADKLHLRRDIYLDQRVKTAVWNEDTACWQIQCNSGFSIEAKYLVSAVGCLSSTNTPDFDGAQEFEGQIYHTGKWPHDGVDFRNKSVAIIGTGSTGIQAIPVIAEEAQQLTVLQRTPNYSVPARNAPLHPDFHSKFTKERNHVRAQMLSSRHGHPWTAPPRNLVETPENERTEILEEAWEVGGLRFRESFQDILFNEQSNKIMSDFIRSKIFEIVENQDTAQKLLPSDHPFATKRPPIDTNYFETYNRKNVHLVDVRENPISKLDKHGLVLEDGTKIEADIIVFATGFDAMSGALLNMDIVGKNGLRLCDAWCEGPKTYLGVGVAHFPNMFIVTGPGSPSVLTNMPRSIEQNVNWITDLLQFAESNKVRSVEVREEAMFQWTEHVNTVASNTLLPKANHSWYLGANIPGKPRVFMPYAGGLDVYSARCEDIAKNGYTGFQMIRDVSMS